MWEGKGWFHTQATASTLSETRTKGLILRFCLLGKWEIEGSNSGLRMGEPSTPPVFRSSAPGFLESTLLNRPIRGDHQRSFSGLLGFRFRGHRVGNAEMFWNGLSPPHVTYVFHGFVILILVWGSCFGQGSFISLLLSPTFRVCKEFTRVWKVGSYSNRSVIEEGNGLAEPRSGHPHSPGKLGRIVSWKTGYGQMFSFRPGQWMKEC